MLLSQKTQTYNLYSLAIIKHSENFSSFMLLMLTFLLFSCHLPPIGCFNYVSTDPRKLIHYEEEN